jgi:hypothetical protein
MTNLAERGPLGENRILKDQLKGRLILSDGGQIFVPGLQLLVYRPCDVGQDACPIIMTSLIPARSGTAMLAADS